MSQKSYDGTPTLYLIPTPIGNMDDITLRSVEILKQVEVIFSEDTRVTRNLLNYLNIKKRLISSHKYNEDGNKEKLINYLSNGYDVGLVSDRGTPVISDPGYILAKEAILEGYNVVGLPGATALIPALIMSGIDPMPFTFYGFLNSKQSKRIQELEELKKTNMTIIFYEAPHRIKDTLEDINRVLGNRYIGISREISKKFEEVYRGKIDEVIPQLIDPKGEFVIVVSKDETGKTFENLTIIQHVNLYIKEGYDSKEAIKLVAKERNVPKSEVYDEYHNIKR